MSYSTCFQRKSDDKIASIKAQINVLKTECEEASVDCFCGFKIVYEYQSKLNYVLLVDLDSVRMQVRIQQNTHELPLQFVAVIEEMGVIGDYPNWCYDYPLYQKGIKTLEGAKEIALTWLKELIEKKVEYRPKSPVTHL